LETLGVFPKESLAYMNTAMEHSSRRKKANWGTDLGKVKLRWVNPTGEDADNEKEYPGTQTPERLLRVGRLGEIRRHGGGYEEVRAEFDPIRGVAEA